jgi:hypothetical protein
VFPPTLRSPSYTGESEIAGLLARQLWGRRFELVLFAVIALLIFGPRRGGQMPSKIAVILGALLLPCLLGAFGRDGI